MLTFLSLALLATNPTLLSLVALRDVTTESANMAVVDGREAAAEAVQLAGSITNDDYPADAAADQAEGVTAVRFTIGADGQVKTCQVTRSSGSALLDEQTCALITARFVFRPARDADGRPIASEREQRVRWELPKIELVEFDEITEYVVTADGRMTDCRFTRIVAGRPVVEACRDDFVRRRFEPDAKGRRRQVRYRETQVITPLQN